MSVEYGDLLDYPLRGDDTVTVFAVMAGVPVVLAIVSVVIAFLSLLIPFLGILNLVLYPVGLLVGVLWLGYFVRIVRSTYAGETKPPALDDWGGLLKDGLFGTVVYLVYSIPLFVLVGVGFVAFVGLVGGAGALAEESAGAALGLLGILVFLVISVLYLAYAVVMSYFAPVSICSYADDRSLSAAFSVDRLRRVALTTDYAVPWALVAGAAFAIQMIVGFLTAFLVGYLLQPLVPIAYFFLGVGSFYLFAQVYDERVRTSAPESRAPADDRSGAGRRRTR
ncbi:hypothetical protein BRD00_00795 [Halobacteriales archaeon QS_8_69_26]|nr:MAG: hypothetical protein BRD00_00795 [Halobacteriales archaeon QS_8_69_26]